MSPNGLALGELAQVMLVLISLYPAMWRPIDSAIVLPSGVMLRNNCLFPTSLAVGATDVGFFEHGFLYWLCLRSCLVVVEERLHLAIVRSLFNLLFLLCLFA